MPLSPKTTSASDAVYMWDHGRFAMDSGYYAGRPPSTSDLDSEILEMFYQGLRKDVSVQAAVSFVRFVDGLKDLSASSFIVAFEKFWKSGCTTVLIEQDAEDRMRLSARGDALHAQAFGAMMSAMGSGKLTPQDIEMRSAPIKQNFIHKHRSELA